MSIKQNGGVFGRNPTFNDVTIEGQLTFDGDIDINSDLKVNGDIEATRLGINIDPQVDIHIANAVSAEIKMEDTGASTSHSIIADGIGLSLRADSAYNDVINILGGAAHQIAFRTNGADAFIVDGAGNIAFQAGKGVDFSATAGTGTSELLDDYEEGLFTPTLTTNGTDFDSVTYDANITGQYTKVGNVVNFDVWMRTDNITKGSASGLVVLGGLPFAGASFGVVSVGSTYAWLATAPTNGYVAGTIVQLTSGANTFTTVADVDIGTNDNEIRVSGTYLTA
tara:strand:- start:1325 stop:2167 length:843 start_codon:yes stop_codon:yes gene_type:complete